MPQRALRSMLEPGHRGTRGHWRARAQIVRQRLTRRVAQKNPPRLCFAAVGVQRQIQAKLPIEFVCLFDVADQGKARVIGLELGSQRLEGHLRPDAGDIAECNADPGDHGT